MFTFPEYGSRIHLSEWNGMEVAIFGSSFQVKSSLIQWYEDDFIKKGPRFDYPLARSFAMKNKEKWIRLPRVGKFSSLRGRVFQLFKRRPTYYTVNSLELIFSNANYTTRQSPLLRRVAFINWVVKISLPFRLMGLNASWI